MPRNERYKPQGKFWNRAAPGGGAFSLVRNKRQEPQEPWNRAAPGGGAFSLVRNKREKPLGLLAPEQPAVSQEGQAILDEIDLLADEMLSDAPDQNMLFVAPPTKRGAKRLKRAVAALFTGAVILSLLLTVMLLLNQFAANGVGGVRFFVEHTDAMRPVIPRGSLLVTRYRAPAKIKQGDIITYYAVPGERGTRLTRIVEGSAEHNGKYTYTTRRASSQQLDSIRINHTYVLGVKLLVIPYFGYVISFVRLYAWGFAVIAAAMCVAAVLLRRWLRDNKGLVLIDTTPV